MMHNPNGITRLVILTAVVALNGGALVAQNPTWISGPPNVCPILKDYALTPPMDFHSAQVYAQGHGATLVSVHGEAETSFLVAAFLPLVPEGHAWIGLTDDLSESNWRWVDASPFDYLRWRPGEPNGGTGENCVLMDLASNGNNGAWSDYPGSGVYRGIIQRIGSPCAMSTLVCNTPVRIGTVATFSLLTVPNTAVFAFVDVAVGSVPLGAYGQSQIAFTTSVLTLSDPTATFGIGIAPAVSSPLGLWTASVPVPNHPALLGVALYSEAYSINFLAPNGLFNQSNLLTITFVP